MAKTYGLICSDLHVVINSAYLRPGILHYDPSINAVLRLH